MNLLINSRTNFRRWDIPRLYIYVVRDPRDTFISLDSFAITDVSFIKIDVEGHEIPVLEGGIRALTECRPVLLLESNETKLTQVRSFLNAIDYQEKSLRQLASVDGAPQNHIFVPI